VFVLSFNTADQHGIQPKSYNHNSPSRRGMRGIRGRGQVHTGIITTLTVFIVWSDHQQMEQQSVTHSVSTLLLELAFY